MIEKKSIFIHLGVGGGQKGLNCVHEVIECPLRIKELLFVNLEY